MDHFLIKKKPKNITPKLALNHPKWNMGKKISIDSATMMNKLFELIEAQKLFEKYKNKIKNYYSSSIINSCHYRI